VGVGAADDGGGLVILSLLLVPALHVTLIGALGGLVGAFAYLDKRIFFAESVTHGTFPGAVLGVVIASALGLGHSGMSAALYVGAFLGTIPLVALMRSLASIPGISSQGAAGIVLTAGFAAGYFLATWFKPLPLAVSSFLTGSVMTVSPADVAWAGAVLTVALAVVAAGHRQLLAHCFDPAEPGAARGASCNERIILGLILAAVTVAIPAVGTILSIALIAAPAAAGEALWAANRTSALSIAAHPVEKDSSIAKIMQIYTIGGLRASKQTLAEQVSKACDSPRTHFCRSSEARFRSVSVFRRTSTRSLAKRGVCAEHAAVTLCAHES